MEALLAGGIPQRELNRLQVQCHVTGRSTVDAITTYFIIHSNFFVEVRSLQSGNLFIVVLAPDIPQKD
jgi:hypothetical protein